MYFDSKSREPGIGAVTLRAPLIRMLTEFLDGRLVSVGFKVATDSAGCRRLNFPSRQHRLQRVGQIVTSRSRAFLAQFDILVVNAA